MDDENADKNESAKSADKIAKHNAEELEDSSADSSKLDDGNQPIAIPEQGRLAGIDFGTQRIGIAVTDPDQTIASPYDNYSRRSEKLDAQFFQNLVREDRVVGFVVGLPVHMSGDESAKSAEARAFGKWLAELTGLPVAWIDERYSTAAAREMLSGSNLSGKKRKAMLDKLAAQVILTSWLESRTGGAGALDD